MTDQPHEPLGPGPEFVPGSSAGLPAPGAPIVGPPGSQAPAYVSAATSTRPRRLAAAAIAVLAVGAGAFGVIALSSGDGADSPEGAVEAMFEAIDQEDVIGVLEALDPNERDILRPAIEETGEQAKRVEVASKDLDLRKVQGIDIQVEGLTFTTESLGDGVTAVDLTGGRVTSSADLDEMAVGATVKTLLDEDDGGDDDRRADDTIELDGIRLVATKAGGGWHVSVLYSIAEQIRLDEHPDSEPPAYGRGIAAKGAESPEAAVREALDAAVHEDYRRLIELTPPGEMAVLHDYGPILLDDAGEPKQDPTVDVTKLELSTKDGPDGTKLVTADAYEAVISDDHGTTTWSYDGSCSTITEDYDYDYDDGYDDEYDDVVEPEDDEPSVYEVCDEDSGLVSGETFLFSFFWGGPGGNLTVSAEEVDGAWYLSPSRTIIESTLGQLRSLSAEDVRKAARVWAGEYWLAEPDEFWEACGVDRPADDASPADGEAAAEECYEGLPGDYDGGFGPGSFFGYGSSTFEPVGEEITFDDDPTTACYAMGDQAAGEACLEDLVASGAVPREELEAFRCGGLFEVLVIDGSSTDEEFEAAEEAYDECLQAAYGEGPTTGTTAAPQSPTTTAPAATTTPAPAPTAPTTAPATTTPAVTTTIPG